MVSRSEIDLKRIKDEYKKNYGKTLHQEILVSEHLMVTTLPKCGLCIFTKVANEHNLKVN